MTLSTTTARPLPIAERPQLKLARSQPRHVNFLALAREMGADAQLNQALRVPGTALLGVATDGVPLMIRLASPDVTHVLVSGSKASGRTEVMRTMLASLVLYQKPHEIQLLLIDPQAKAFQFLAHSPNLVGDVATTPERALQHLRWLENEMERREREMVALPRLVVVIDDLAELVESAGQSAREFQVHLARLAQYGRRTGISLIVATQKANASGTSPALRANFPVRLLGKGANDNDGSANLAGRGDFILMAGGERVRFQAAYLPPEDLPAFEALARANRAAKRGNQPGLGDLVRRLRRIK